MESLSESIGVPVSALKLVGSLFAGYPLALSHRYLFWGKSQSLQNIFFAATGMSMIYWCYGNDLIHSAICTLAQWAILKVFVFVKIFHVFGFCFSRRLAIQNLGYTFHFYFNLVIYWADMFLPKRRVTIFAGPCPDV